MAPLNELPANPPVNTDPRGDVALFIGWWARAGY